jgi:hypothetical protein
MKATTRKNACMVALAIATSANAPAILADIYFGPSVRLGTADRSTDVYGLTCPLGTATVQAQVGNVLGGDAEFINVQVINPNGDGTSANAREGVPSPTIALLGQQF